MIELTPWSVRSATPVDADACLTLLRSATSRDAGPLGRIGWSHPRVAGLVAADAAAGRLYLVTDHEGGLVATFAVCDEPDAYFAGIAWAEPHAPARYLHRLAVTPTLHGNGLGSWTLRRAESVAAAQGARYLRLDALQRDARVLRFYMRCGYADRGVVLLESGDREQPQIPLACFERAL